MAILEVQNLSRRQRRQRLQQLMKELGLDRLAKSKAYTLSGGERRRLEITRALVISPQLILLDEPFSGVDPIAVFDVQQIILELKKRGLGILLTDHNVRETLSITDRSYIMYESKILISGTSEELINDPRAREIYLGEQFSM
jgi:lipopolysaccharide export system ATP-binding protein